MTIRVVTDSNCDLPPDLVEQHGIAVVPLHINVGRESYLDGVEMSRQQFYEGLPSFSAHPTTSVPSPGEFYQVYRRLADEGADQILSIHISVALSAVVNSARLAAEELPTLPVTVYDSGNLTLGTGFQVLAAAQAAADGATMDEILALLQDQNGRTHTYAVLDTLEYLRRSGRLSRLQMHLGSLLQLKPIITMNAGEPGLERVRTRKAAEARLLQMVEDLGPLEHLAVVHTHAPQRVPILQEMARPLFPSGQPSLVAEVTSVIGSHIGPGAAGFVAVQAPRA